MALGFVLVDCAPQQEEHVLRQLSALPEVLDVQPLFGEFDIIVKLEAVDFDALGQAIVSKIRCIDGVVSTKTLAAGPVDPTPAKRGKLVTA